MVAGGQRLIEDDGEIAGSGGLARGNDLSGGQNFHRTAGKRGARDHHGAIGFDTQNVEARGAWRILHHGGRFAVIGVFRQGGKLLGFLTAGSLLPGLIRAAWNRRGFQLGRRRQKGGNQRFAGIVLDQRSRPYRCPSANRKGCRQAGLAGGQQGCETRFAE